MEYVKPWLSIGEQIEKLASKGVRIGDRGVAGSVLREVGYYRLTGYLYPFRESSFEIDDDGRRDIEVQDRYRAGTEFAAAGHRSVHCTSARPTGWLQRTHGVAAASARPTGFL